MTEQRYDVIPAMRIDKWLWCARFYKTRAMAATAIEKGRIQVNNNPVKPAFPVRAGDTIRIKSGPYLLQLTVQALAKNRGNAQLAALLYQEDPASIEQRRLTAEQLRANHTLHPHNHGKPTKRDRRKLSEFKKRLT